MFKVSWFWCLNRWSDLDGGSCGSLQAAAQAAGPTRPVLSIFMQGQYLSAATANERQINNQPPQLRVFFFLQMGDARRPEALAAAEEACLSSCVQSRTLRGDLLGEDGDTTCLSRVSQLSLYPPLWPVIEEATSLRLLRDVSFRHRRGDPGSGSAARPRAPDQPQTSPSSLASSPPSDASPTERFQPSR